MERVEKTVFVSYRRTNIPWALAIFQNLTQHGFDVFFDYNGIASGDFERVILGNIKARAHFLVLLTPSALKRCSEPEDWLRREIEAAMSSQRNVVPVMLEGFDFGRVENAPFTLEPPIEDLPIGPDSRDFGVPESSLWSGVVCSSSSLLDLVPGSGLPGARSSRSSGKADGQSLRWFDCAPGAAHSGDRGSGRCFLFTSPRPWRPD